jgi:hypothetical protein
LVTSAGKYLMIFHFVIQYHCVMTVYHLELQHAPSHHFVTYFSQGNLQGTFSDYLQNHHQ